MTDRFEIKDITAPDTASGAEKPVQDKLSSDAPSLSGLHLRIHASMGAVSSLSLKFNMSHKVLVSFGFDIQLCEPAVPNTFCRIAFQIALRNDL